MKINQNNIEIDYSCLVIESFSPFNKDCWALILHGDSWYVERIFGIGKVIEYPYKEIPKDYREALTRVAEWKPVYMEYGCLTPIQEGKNFTLIFDKMPTQKDADEFKKWIDEGNDDDCFNQIFGEFDNKETKESTIKENINIDERRLKTQ